MIAKGHNPRIISKTLRLGIIIHAVQSNKACLFGYDFKINFLRLILLNVTCLYQFVVESYTCIIKQYEGLATLEVQY